MVVGTAGYMSPEQVAGRAVDARSDIFSFGCMLYEAAARQRPFVGDTTVDTLHKILNEQPRPVEELNPRVPADLRKVIRRCLAKSADQRYQSVKDVAIELREIGEQWETLPTSGRSDSGAAGTASGASSAVPRRSRRWLLAGAAAVALIAVTAAIAWFVVPRLRTGPASGADPLQTLKITSIVSGNDLNEPALSPDGRYLGYVNTAGGRCQILVRQVATGSEVRVVEPQPAALAGLSFSPDGQYLYYLTVDAAAGIRTLFAVPSLGGSPRKILTDVDSAVVFSPDGKQFALLRGVPRTNEVQLVVFDSATRAERLLAALKGVGQQIDGGLRWSQDGRRVSVVSRNTVSGTHPELQVVSFDVETGQRSLDTKWPNLASTDVAWMAGDQLLVSVSDNELNSIQQLQLLAEGASPRRVTNDQNSYSKLSVSADHQTVAALRVSETRTLWSVPLSGAGEPLQVPISVSNPSLLAATADGMIVFRRDDGVQSALWSARPDGSGLRQITPEYLFVMGLCGIPGKNAVVFQGGELASGLPNLWRVDSDGANLVQLPRDPGPTWLHDVTPDGRYCLFSHSNGSLLELYRQPLDGGAPPAALDKNPGASAVASPDGKLIARFRYQFGEQNATGLLVVIPAEGGDPLATLNVGVNERWLTWAGDSSAVAYVTSEGGVDTMMRWPIAGGSATPLFRFAKGRIRQCQWTRDGTNVLFSAQAGQATNLWTWRPGMAEPQPVTRFPSGDARWPTLSPDSATVYFSLGFMTSDIVLIRGIK
jgi:Tol biopolymer transport system component